MSIQSKAWTAAVVAGSIAYGRHWRRRALASSSIEVESAVAAGLAYLATADTTEVGATAIVVLEEEFPPAEAADRRWYWWACATCPACDGVHDAWSRFGREPSELAAWAEVHEHIRTITDLEFAMDCGNPYRCPNVVHQHEHEDEADEGDDEASAA